MFIVRVNRFLGFTLLEIIMAVAILSTMAIAIYRFVESNIIAIRVSSDTVAADARYDGLREVLANQWQSLAPGKGSLLGASRVPTWKGISPRSSAAFIADPGRRVWHAARPGFRRGRA